MSQEIKDVILVGCNTGDMSVFPQVIKSFINSTWVTRARLVVKGTIKY